MATFPDTDTDAALMAPVVLMVVEPPMTDAPFMVPAVITGLINVLLVRVSDAVCVTTTPELGKVAVELSPIPPRFVGKIPVPAAL